jgi:hypothetical protein
MRLKLRAPYARFVGFHGGEDSSHLLGCDAVQCFGRIQVFLKSVLPPSSG